MGKSQRQVTPVVVATPDIAAVQEQSGGALTRFAFPLFGNLKVQVILYLQYVAISKTLALPHKAGCY